MKHIVVGTAGHIDHGKSALVEALTGTHPDRLSEEKRRGISIDLGFAHLQLAADLRIAFIDVPGHEKFIKNMLAGVGGIDLALLVIAGDESIRPQTREHFDICRLLGISSGLIAITKSDLVPPDLIDLVRLEAEEFVAGSFLANCPILPVSSKTGSGLEELKHALLDLASRIPARPLEGPARLPVDRSFAMKGFGSVVTGTLLQGSISLDQDLEILPAHRRVRVRGIQVHGSAGERAVAGQRVALNLSGIDHVEISRGMVVAQPGAFAITRTVDCELDLLGSAKPLKHRAPVHFHAGAAEIEAEVRLFGEERLEPGQRALVRLILREGLPLAPGDRFILRMFSPVTTIAGGRVVDAQPPARKPAETMIRRLKTLAGGRLEEKLLLIVEESGHGLAAETAAMRLGVTLDAIRAEASKSGVDIVRIPEEWLISHRWIASTLARWTQQMADFHAQNPLAPGMPREEFRTQQFADAPPALFDVLLKKEAGVASDGELIRLASHRLNLRDEERTALAVLEEAFARAGLAVPAQAEILERTGLSRQHAQSLLQILLRNRTLVRVTPDLVFHRDALETLKRTIQSHRGHPLAVPTFKDWTGLSRKYAIPLLEYLDRERITRRQGDQRIVL